jgi:hypothetical protein
MPPIIAGSNLSDLSRNSLLQSELAANERATIADELLRRRSQDNEMARFGGDLGYRYAGLGQQGQQFDSDLGFRREAMNQRGRMFDGDLALRRDDLNNRWSKVTPDAAAQLQFQKEQIDSALINQLLYGNSGYPAGKGGDEMRLVDQDANLKAATAATAMNNSLNAELSTLQGDLDTSRGGWGWLNWGMNGEDAASTANYLRGVKDATLPPGAEKTYSYRTVTDWAKNLPNNLLSKAPPEISGMVDVDYTGRLPKFVPKKFGPAASNGLIGDEQKKLLLQNMPGRTGELFRSVYGTNSAPVVRYGRDVNGNPVRIQ